VRRVSAEPGRYSVRFTLSLETTAAREPLRRIRFLLHRAEYERNPEEKMRHHLAPLEEGGNRALSPLDARY
jgi:hypothetical protein